MQEVTMRAAFKKAGLKATPGRIAILKLFSTECHPQSVEDVFRALDKKVDQVTVYRTLAAFEKAGLLRRVDLRTDAVLYERNTEEEGHHHHHVVCESCGAIEHIHVSEPKYFERTALKESQAFAKITAHSLEFFGMCKQCFTSNQVSKL